MKVTLTKPDKKKYVIPKGTETFTIGRKPTSDLQIKLKQISRDHCEIVINELGVHIKDNGSKFGTAVNGKTLSKDEHAALSDGDTIQIGSYILKVYIKDDDNKSNKPVPIDQTPSEKEKEVKLTPVDSDIEEFSDSALGLNENNNQSIEPLKIPSTEEIEKDLRESEKQLRTKN